jgi:hypothetical protein
MVPRFGTEKHKCNKTQAISSRIILALAASVIETLEEVTSPTVLTIIRFLYRKCGCHLEITYDSRKQMIVSTVGDVTSSDASITAAAKAKIIQCL